MMKRALFIAAVAVGSSAILPAQAIVPQAITNAASATSSFTLPAGWKQSQPSANVRLIEAPEGDYQIAIVEVGLAADAKAAGAAAWSAYRKEGARAFKLVTARAPRNGWDEIAVVEYETSPSEHVAAYASARRRGDKWTVFLVNGSEATAEKRAGDIGTMGQSLRPAGYVRETFAGRKAHRLDAARVAEMTEFVRAAAAELGVPGVGFALIDHGKIVYEGGVGVRELGKPDPVDAHTRFMIASNTKSMATLLLAQLIDEGKLRWDQPVTEIYPSFRLGSEATTKTVLVRHLVCACTGLPRKDLEWLFNTTRATPASDTFRQLALTEPTSKFGEAFQYNNLMASAAGYIAGHLAYPKMEIGQAFDRAVQRKIFDPLGMRDSTFSMREALAANHASPHSEDMDGKVVVIPQDLNYAVGPFRPAGGAWSSPHDMIRYIQSELDQGRLASGGRLVSAENMLARRARGVVTGEDQWYGMGLWEDSTWGVPVIHHGGDLGGYHSDMIAIPGAQVGAVILTNADNGPAMRRPFMRRLLEILYDGKPEARADVTASAKRIAAQRVEWRSKLVTPADPAVTGGLAKAYISPDLGRLEVAVSGSGAVLKSAVWASSVATRRNEDGSISLITTDPEVAGLDLVVGKDAAGKRTLTTRDGQHVYVFTEVS